MRTVLWTKKTPITKDNFDRFVEADYENYATLVNSQDAPIAIKSSATGYVMEGAAKTYLGGYGVDYRRDHWEVVEDLTIEDVAFVDSGLYRISLWQPKIQQTNFPDSYDGFEVAIRMDKTVLLSNYIADTQLGCRPLSVYIEAYLKIYKPEKHSFEAIFRGNSSNESNKVEWGSGDNGEDSNLTAFLVVQRIGS